MNSKLLFGSFSALLLTGGMIFTTGCESIDDDPMPPGAYVPPATVDPIAVKGGENAPAAPVGEPVVLPAPEPAEPVFIVQPPVAKPAPQKPLPPKKARKPQPKKRQAPAETSTHIIKKGESFWSIAALYGIEMDDIAAANPKLNPKKLHVGGKLIIPGAAERKERAAKAPKKVKRSEKRAKKTVAKLENEEGVYIVRNGDSLSRIAARHHVKVSALAAANNINVDQMLRIGQKLVIPKPGKAVKPAKKTTAKPVNTASNKAPKKTSEPASATETAVPPTPSSDLFPQSGYVPKYTNPPPKHDVPEAYLADETFAAILKEAEKYLGFPYVWGGSSPSTSFDCSGFVSYVYNQCGWSFGRLGAQGLYNICSRTSSPRPGDLVFFVGTYDTAGISHVGIYVGDGWMLHCGDPISYANLNSSYWQSHLYAYGRLP